MAQDRGAPPALAAAYYPDVYAQLLGQTSEHEMTVLHADGLYRHLRFARPGTGIWQWDLVTWPGHLTIVGDIGSGYTFSRTDDMLAFFDHGQGEGRINPHYWAEKLAGGRRSVLVFSPERFTAHVNDLVAAAIEDAELDEDAAADLSYRVGDAVLASSDEEYYALEALGSFQLPDWAAGQGSSRRLDDEMDPAAWTDYDHHFLLACHAILWGARVFHAVQRSESAPEA